ncbi:MAG TPA: homoserine kinase [Kineosporiaceae bacterium]|nr:homoserine kinase [Kineosporiaceae bacterium]
MSAGVEPGARPDDPACPQGATPAGDTAGVVGVRLGVTVTVRTPATSANLGPGFDSLGLALALHDVLEVEATADGGVEVMVTGEGAGEVPQDERHLVVRAIRAGLEQAGAGRPGLRLFCRNVIPHGRGLGSSASAVVAGLVAARALLADPAALDEATLLRLATAFEGHPDNAAAALLGGFTISWTESAPGPLDAVPAPVAAGDHGGSDRSGATETVLSQAFAVRVPVHPQVRVVACVPDCELATEVARKMLPAQVPHADAAFNAGRSALLVEALSRQPELLTAATADRLHQGQRAAAMPASARLIRSLRSAGVAAVVSGAGPSVLALGTGDEVRARVEQVLAGQGPGWRALLLEVDTLGATVVTESTCGA